MCPSLITRQPGSWARLFATGLLACALLTSGAARADTGDITISGSTTLEPVLQRIASEFMRDHPGRAVTVQAGGSGAGIAALLSGESDIASSSRFIDEDELERARKDRIYPVPIRVADDCIIPIVHQSNGLRDLRLEDLKRIYLGQVKNWKELGGRDREIQVISRTPDSGTYGVWSDLVMGDGKIVGSAGSKATSSEVVRAVARNTGAIGYVSLGHLSASVKPLRVNGVMGSIGSMEDGSYSLSRPLFLFTRGWPEGRALQFINYVLKTDKGQKAVRKMGLIPVHKRK